MRWQIEFPSNPASVRAARGAVRERLTGHTSSDIVDDIALIVSELVTNSVRYGPGDPITLTLDAESPTRISGEVADKGDAWISVEAVETHSFPTEGGLGLPIIAAIATEWGVYEASTHFWFVVER